MPYLEKNKIALIEDHHQAYFAWKKRKLKSLSLVHIDAHMDFGFPQVKDIPLIIKEAKSLAEIKSAMERHILFKRKGFKLEELTNIANYIYPAMRDGIVKDFYWVIPGDKTEFRNCLKRLKRNLRNLFKKDPLAPPAPLRIKNGLLEGRLYANKLVISCLENLPKISSPALLDIDVDFLVINSIKKAASTQEIGRRRVWIKPARFTGIIKEKINNPAFATIAYSVNGGFTPLVFKYLGEEIACRLAGKKFRRPAASINFSLFNLYAQKRQIKKAQAFYAKTLRNDPNYGCWDNNYGPLYLAIRRLKLAETEFKKILSVDPGNKSALSGLGELNLEKKKYPEAEKYFQQALKVSPGQARAMFGLARLNFKLKKYNQAERWLLRYQKKEQKQPLSHYLLAQIYQKKGYWRQAALEYRNAWQLGANKNQIRAKLSRCSKRLKSKV